MTGAACALAAAAAVVVAGSQTPPPKTPPTPAQVQAKPDEPQRPTFRAEANLVRVDVFPTVDGLPVLDLTRDDFQVLEDGVPQAIDSFEHVIVRPAGAEAERVEPNTQREGDAMAADPHNRVFVIFLDTYHVSYAGSYNIRRPLITMIDRLLAPDDLVGVITPEQPASQLILGRKTDVIARGLTDTWFWGARAVQDRVHGADRRALRRRIARAQVLADPGSSPGRILPRQADNQLLDGAGR